MEEYNRFNVWIFGKSHNLNCTSTSFARFGYVQRRIPNAAFGSERSEETENNCPSFQDVQQFTLTMPWCQARKENSRTEKMTMTKNVPSQPLASQAGIEILKKGGNAADAAVAIAAALNVTEPMSTGIGGDAFCLFYDAKERRVKALNGSGRTPAALTLEHLRNVDKLKNNLPVDHVHAVTVPGAAAAWVDTVETFGSGKVDMATILNPAIDLAQNGYPVSHIAASMWKEAEQTLVKANPTSEVELLIDHRAPGEGEIITLPGLADTFKALASEGKAGFYQGRIAESIVSAVRSRGGLMTLDDLANHSSELVEPISIDYHGHTVWECPPNGQGITALIALGIIEALHLDISQLKHNSAEYLHVVTEALRLAFADTRHFVTDPRVEKVPTQKLLSKEYIAERAKLIDLTQRNNTIEHGYPDKSGNTVYFSVVDEEGNACSFINSVYMHFGSGIIPDGCGFALHNRGCNFVLVDGHANCIGPAKRPYHTIIPSMITRRSADGGHDLDTCFGVMGAFMQPQGQVQVVLNLMHYLYDPQYALDLPRICIAQLQPTFYEFDDVNAAVVCVEEGIPQETIQALEAKGHKCVRVTNYKRQLFGRGQIIRVKKDPRTGKRVLSAGSDPRGDGYSIGW
ncbi:hypothetical protein EC973_002973 [Apophysomyces ossiformis]|uniref:Gamma-glutamyltransferase n=1 Tax=Apophysomyces ossiformis TaxID=679940 RepID=A0A8H7BRS3_9FUNG|nr:hypothetical protein EC973_002973 [Apophysomyces ossiformis]